MQYIANTCEKLNKKFYQLEYASCYFIFDMMKDTIVPINVTIGSNTIVHIFFCYLHSNKRTCMCFFVFFKCLQHDYLSTLNPRAGEEIGPFLIQIKILTFLCQIAAFSFKNHRHSGFFFLFHFKTAAFSSWKQMVWEIEFILSFFQRTFQFPLMRVKLTLNSGV